MLKERNKSYGAISFVDISSQDYSPKDNMGLDYETVRTDSRFGLLVSYSVYVEKMKLVMHTIHYLSVQISVCLIR